MGSKAIEIPEEILNLLRSSRLKQRSEGDQVKAALAIHLVLEEVISTGKAAALAGENRIEFEHLLVDMASPLHSTTWPTISRTFKRLRGFRADVCREGRFTCRPPDPASTRV